MNLPSRLGQLKRSLLPNFSPPNCSLFSASQEKYLLSLPRFQPGVINSSLGQLSYVDACTAVVCAREIFRDQCYRFDTLSPKVIIDCGANIGVASIWFAYFYPSATINAYEADPKIFQALEQNIIKLGLLDKVIPLNKAVWSHGQGITFMAEGGSSGRVVDPHESASDRDKLIVNTISLSEILSSHESIDLLKIDIEGGENTVLLDSNVDLGRVKRIFLEYHSLEGKMQLLPEILHAFRRQGFRFYIKEARVPANPFMEVASMEGMDMQLNIYCTKDA